MTHSDVAHVRVGEPGTLIDAVPYMLGFHPRESLVLLGLDRRTHAHQPEADRSTALRRVEVVLRVDIPQVAGRPGDFDELLHALRRSQVSEVVCIWLTDQAGVSPHRDESLLALSSALCGDALAQDVDILDVLVASHDRWWSLTCLDPRCCPDDGTPRSAGTSVVAAQAIVSGLVALPERASVQSQLVGESPDAREGLRPAIMAALAEQELRRLTCAEDPGKSVADDLALFIAAARRCRAADRSIDQLGPLDDTHGKSAAKDSGPNEIELARLGACLCDLGVRDEVWLLIDEGALDADGLLYQLLRRLPIPYVSPPLFLFGWSRWRRGEGTLAAMAAEQALASDPRYSAADLLLVTVRGGMDPRRTPPLRRAWDAAQLPPG
jgi:hypothetical protein